MPLRRLLSACVLMTALSILVGCPAAEEEFKPAENSTEVAEAPPHVHVAPHGGMLMELGAHQYSAELVMDKDTKTIEIYVLDAHAEKPQPIEATELEMHLQPEGGEETEVTLKAVPLATDPEGKSSRFSAEGALTDALAAAEHLHGHVHITIDGTEFEGELPDDHDHEHGGEGEPGPPPPLPAE